MSVSCVPQVVATDADGPDFASLQYSLSDGFDRKDLHPLFHINTDTGEVCVSQDIDHDTGQTSHDILVKAVDQVSVFSSHLSKVLLSKVTLIQFTDMSLRSR